MCLHNNIPTRLINQVLTPKKICERLSVKTGKYCKHRAFRSLRKSFSTLRSLTKDFEKISYFCEFFFFNAQNSGP